VSEAAVMMRESSVPVGEVAMYLWSQGFIASSTDQEQEGTGSQKVHPKLPRWLLPSSGISPIHFTPSA
jgi:hypothetical protein